MFTSLTPLWRNMIRPLHPLAGTESTEEDGRFPVNRIPTQPHADLTLLQQLGLFGLTRSQAADLAYLLASYVAFRSKPSDNYSRVAMTVVGYCQTALMLREEVRDEKLPYIPIPRGTNGGGYLFLRSILSLVGAKEPHSRDDCVLAVLNRFYLLISKDRFGTNEVRIQPETPECSRFRDAAILLRDYVMQEDTSVEAFVEDLNLILESGEKATT
jgi:hypothetical protein